MKKQPSPFRAQKLKQVSGLQKCSSNYCNKFVKEYMQMCDRCMRENKFQNREHCREELNKKFASRDFKKYNQHIAHLYDR